MGGRRGQHGHRRLVPGLLAAVLLVLSMQSSMPAASASGPQPGPVGAADGVSYAGEWTATGTSQTCGLLEGQMVCGPTTDAAPRTLRLKGVCDGVGGCSVELVSGFTWTPIPNPLCAAPYGDAGFRITTSFPLTDLKATFGTDPETSAVRIALDVVSPVAPSPPTARRDVLTAVRTSIPAGSDDSECKPPLPPTGVTATAGDGTMTVEWTAPADNGSGDVLGYVATASPGGATCLAVAPATSCAISGLTNGRAYTFTVVARNGTGDSPASSPSAATAPTSCGPAGSGPFGDVGGGHTFCGDIEWLVGNGVAGGYGDGTFKPTAPVSRQAMARFLHRAAGSPAFTDPAVPTFKDVPKTDGFFHEIEWLNAQKITTGYGDQTFRSTGSVTRESMAAFLYRFAGRPAFTPPANPTFPDVPTTATFFGEIEWLASTKVTTGYADGFRPSAIVTRQSMAAFLHRFADKHLRP